MARLGISVHHLASQQALSRRTRRGWLKEQLSYPSVVRRELVGGSTLCGNVMLFGVMMMMHAVGVVLSF